MSLARAWRRQLYGASSAALIVPSAMLAALLLLALGGGFGQVGVLGQIFAGPPAPSIGGGAALGGRGAVAAPSLPAIAAIASGPVVGRHSRAGRGAAPVAVHSGSRHSGGALPQVGAALPIAVTGGSTPVRPGPTGSVPTAVTPTSSAAPPPAPPPSPKPTVVDRVIKVVAPVTERVPAPVGPAVTQAVEAAGSAADSVLPPGVGSGVGSGAAVKGLKLP